MRRPWPHWGLLSLWKKKEKIILNGDIIYISKHI
jgi:hypothetical protein